MMILLIVIVLMMALLGGPATPQFRVGYLVEDGKLSVEQAAAWEWLSSQSEIKSFKIKISDVHSSAELQQYSILWLHLPDAEHHARWRSHPGKEDILKEYYTTGGKLLLTDYGAFLPYEMGIESRLPEARALDIKDEGYGRKYGFQSFRGHPLFQNFFGGAYVWDADRDHTAWRVGYFEHHWPEQGKVVAVEKAYVRLSQDHKLVIEYESGPGRLLSVGAFIYFSGKNYLRLHTEHFLKNAIRYLSGQSSKNIPVTYWTADKDKPEPFQARSIRPLEPKHRSLSRRGESPLLLTHELATDNFFDLAGRRCLIMGQEKGGIEEVWVHPFRVLRDLEVGIVVHEEVVWLRQLPSRIEVRPESLTRIYETPFGKLREIVFASYKLPGGMLHFEVAHEGNVRLVVRFRSDLRWMWPYRENTLGSLNFAYDEVGHALHVKDRSGDFYCLFGGDVEPITQLDGPYQLIDFHRGKFKGEPTSLNQVYQAFLFELNEENQHTLNFAFVGTDQGREEAENAFRMLLNDPLTAYQEIVTHYRGLLTSCTLIQTPDENFNTGYQWALIATDRFYMTTPNLGSALVAGFATTASGWDGGHTINGRPGYAWYFARDAEWAALAIDGYGDFRVVKDQLRMFKKFQDISGKIFHELSTSGVVHYDAADATPLYIILAAHYLRHSGDLEFIRELWPSIKKAMDFLYQTDRDGDGLIENTHVGHGWIEGGNLYGARTTLYLAGLWAQSLRDAAYLADKLGKVSWKVKYEARAHKVLDIIHRDFWNPTDQFFFYGKASNGSFNPERTILPAVLMNFKLLESGKVGKMLEEYASNAFSTDWGVRILSEASPWFNPRGYHSGSVWPLFTGWTALAEYRYGRSVQGFTHLMNSLNVYRYWALGFIEEVLHGERFRPNGVCPHQCWSETSVLIPALFGLVGFYPDAPENRLHIIPRFPIQWDNVAVVHLRVGSNRLNMRMRRSANTTRYRFQLSEGNELQVQFSVEVPLGMRVSEVVVAGESRSFRQQGNFLILDTSFILTTNREVDVVLHHRGGIGVVAPISQPEPGEVSGGLSFLHDQWAGKVYRITVEGRSGGNGTLLIRLFDEQILEIKGAELKNMVNDQGFAELSVHFKKSTKKYVRKVVSVRLR